MNDSASNRQCFAGDADGTGDFVGSKGFASAPVHEPRIASIGASRGGDSSDMSGPLSAYRAEQTRLLRKSLLGRMSAMLAIWTVGFLLFALAFNAVAVPAISDLVVEAVAPWRYVDPEDSGAKDWEEFQSAAQRTKEGMASDYVFGLYLDAEEPQRDGLAEDSPEATAILEKVRAAQPTNGVSGGDAGEPDDPEGLSRASEVINSEVTRLAQSDSGSFDRLLDEAFDYFGCSEASTVVNGVGGFYEEYYLDGHYRYRDMTAYNVVKSFKIPLAIVVFMAGIAAIVWSVLRRSLHAFDVLFDAMEAVLLKRDSDLDLPDELEPTSRALRALRREIEINEMAARMAEQRKNELVAYLAHDIRTPLTSVVGYLTMLEESADMSPEQRTRFAGIALDRAQRLEGMLEEFFEITRYNLRSIPIEREWLDAGVLCRQVVDEFFPIADARGIDILVEADSPMNVFADAEKVSRVLNNLLKNAVSYANEGSTVHVCAKIEGRLSSDDAFDGQDRCSMLVIEVENQGREIAPAHLEAIFEKFYRENEARSAKEGGAGLGLAIAREIARAHGGDLTAQSHGGTTVFALSIPV